MCGIAGILTFGGKPLDTARLKGMVDVIAHRGPDDAGYYLCQTGNRGHGDEAGARSFTDRKFSQLLPTMMPIDTPAALEVLHSRCWDLFLGHRRLSIIDLTSAGHQPMGVEAGDFWITYNGEIYNFPELRVELETLGHDFVSRTDTEVILRAYQEWGAECVKRFNGMFAFALWDNRRQKLFLARDRYGIKPLYYRIADSMVVFGSEIKSILHYLPEHPGMDLLALNEYFSFQNVLSDRTLFEGIRILPPGYVMTVCPGTGAVHSEQYWDFDFSKESKASEVELQEELYRLIRQAVKRQCISDVPIGSYLSGGMDSGTITALTSKHFGRINTFTMGFDLSEAAEHEQCFDERELAERMASMFQTEHYECVLHAGDMAACMDDLIYHLEDLRVGQCYPNWYVSRLAGKFVKVVMSGAGGDELFGGYPWRYAAAIGPSHEDYVQNYYKYWKRLVPNRDKPNLYHPDVVAALRGMSDHGAVPFRDHTLSVFKRVLAGHERPSSIEEQVNNSLYFECKTFLHGLLVVEDKLSMAHSLETRVPLLDNDLVDFACTVPVRMKVSGIEHLERIDENLVHKKRLYTEQISPGKSILRKVMERILPAEITTARKQGFSAPDESWFRGRVEAYIRDVLFADNQMLRSYVSGEYMQNVLAEHRTGRTNRRLLIWSLLSFRKWLTVFGG